MARLRLRTLALVALGTALPCAVTAVAPRVARAEIVDRVVATIEDDAIFLSELERRVRPFERELEEIQNTRERAHRREQMYRETLDRMVDDQLIRRAATRAHVTVTDADVDRMIEGIARQRNATPSDLYAAVEHEGITRAEYRSFMESEVLRLRVLNARVRGRVNISDQDVAEEYRRRVRELQSRAPFHLAHIFVSFPDNPTSEQITAAQHRAEQIAARARNGEDFAALAQELSDDPDTRNAGGDLGNLDPSAEQNAPPAWIVSAVRDLQPGQVAAPVRSDESGGYHVFKLISRETVNPPPLSEVRTDLYQDLLQREMNNQQRQYLRELRQRSAVVFHLD